MVFDLCYASAYPMRVFVCERCSSVGRRAISGERRDGVAGEGMRTHGVAASISRQLCSDVDSGSRMESLLAHSQLTRPRCCNRYH